MSFAQWRGITISLEFGVHETDHGDLVKLLAAGRGGRLNKGTLNRMLCDRIVSALVGTKAYKRLGRAGLELLDGSACSGSRLLLKLQKRVPSKTARPTT